MVQPLTEEINRLEELVNALKAAESDYDKIEILSREPVVELFIAESPFLQRFLVGLEPVCELVIKSILAIGQGPVVFQQADSLDNCYDELRKMIDFLKPVEKFYAHCGGIVGYHTLVLTLIAEKKGLLKRKAENELYTKPTGLDLSHETPAVLQALRQGIESTPQMAEIYPVGGAGDRLQLCDEYTGEPLPVAFMDFCGRTLLEGLIRDLQAREFLYYRLTGKQSVTPIAMMTSHEKNNHAHIQTLCTDAGWFGRPADSFRFFTQPLVPVIAEEGNWCLSAPFHLIVKPGGHGVMWKLAQDAGIFRWFHQAGRGKALVRQINNPMAGIDLGLLAFIGTGCTHKKLFGFASCYRALKSAEGMNVLRERVASDGVACCITNVEYTDFAVRGIQDEPAEPGSVYSAFPANTNILFADLKAVEDALEVCPVPGLILNMKTAVDCLDADGQLVHLPAGRLESTMQNIADYIEDVFPGKITEAEQARLKTFLTYNHRHKTISVTKNSYSKGKPLMETPEGCFYDKQRNAYELLSHHCGIDMPHLREPANFMEEGPSFLVDYHPALGPLYSIIAAKIRGGKLADGSELRLEAAEVDIENLILDGSLIVAAISPLGHITPEGTLEYSRSNGKCTLVNVTIENKGVCRTTPQRWWKGDIQREECLEIILHGNGEFFAKDVVIKGNQRIEVADGYRYEAVPSEEGFRLIKREITSPTWWWEYSFDDGDRIQLKKSV